MLTEAKWLLLMHGYDIAGALAAAAFLLLAAGLWRMSFPVPSVGEVQPEYVPDEPEHLRSPWFSEETW